MMALYLITWYSTVEPVLPHAWPNSENITEMITSKIRSIQLIYDKICVAGRQVSNHRIISIVGKVAQKGQKGQILSKQKY